jgi:hypothetical protein
MPFDRTRRMFRIESAGPSIEIPLDEIVDVITTDPTALKKLVEAVASHLSSTVRPT